jgi:preprotein translocase subunit SecE
LAKTSPAQFIREVRQETAKVTWPSRKETGVTTVMVFIMVVVMAAFFAFVDVLLGSAVRFLLGLGG